MDSISGQKTPNYLFLYSIIVILVILLMSQLLLQSHQQSPTPDPQNPPKKLLEREKRQRYRNSSQRKNRTECDEFVQDLTPTQNGTRLCQRKFIQQSVFLPAINKKSRATYDSFENQYKNKNNTETFHTNLFDTEAETMEYLNQCQKIIENLKKLTNISASKISDTQRKRGRDKFLYQNNRESGHYSRQSKQRASNQYRNQTQKLFDLDEHNNEYIRNSNPQAERGPSFIASIQDDHIYEKEKVKKFEKIERKNPKKVSYTASVTNTQPQQQPRKKKSLKLEIQVHSSYQQAEDANKYKKSNNKSPQFQEQYEESTESIAQNKNYKENQQQSHSKMGKKVNKIVPINQKNQDSQIKIKAPQYFQGENNFQPEKHRKKQSQYTIESSRKEDKQIPINNSKMSAQNSEKNDKQYIKQAEIIETKTQQQLEKAQRKHRYLLKYLGKAIDGGCSLHRKIMQYNNKNGRIVKVKFKPQIIPTGIEQKRSNTEMSTQIQSQQARTKSTKADKISQFPQINPHKQRKINTDLSQTYKQSQDQSSNQ